jgi:hypothetical protein
LVLLDRLEERLEVAIAKTLAALALDDLEEDRHEDRARENRQEQATILGWPAINKDTLALRRQNVLAMVGRGAS